MKSIVSIQILLLAMACGSQSKAPEKPVPKPKPKSVPESQDSQSQPNDEDLELSQSIEEQKATLLQRDSSIQAERDRSTLLKLALSGGQKGCMAEVALKKLEIRVKGTWLERAPQPSSSQAKSSSGSPEAITIQLSDSIVLSYDEKTQSLFQPSGKLVSLDYQDYRVRDIETIIIKKGGVAIESQKNCKTTLGIESCSFTNYEASRYAFSDFEIWVNDQAIYRRSQIAAELSQTNMEWHDDNITLNEAWLKAMSKQDCSAKGG